MAGDERGSCECPGEQERKMTPYARDGMTQEVRQSELSLILSLDMIFEEYLVLLDRRRPRDAFRGLLRSRVVSISTCSNS